MGGTTISKVERGIAGLDPVFEFPGHDGTFAIVANARPARPPDRHVARFRELEQAGIRGAPGYRQTAAHEVDARALADGAGGRMRGNAALGDGRRAEALGADARGI